MGSGPGGIFGAVFGYRFLRGAGVALIVYGLLGLLIATAMAVVGYTTIASVQRVQRDLDQQRLGLVTELRLASRTLATGAAATAGFQKSIDQARTAADTATQTSTAAATNFRELAAGMNLTVFGYQPFATVAPRFVAMADQLDQLAGTLGSTRDAMSQNTSDVQQLGGNLDALRTQLDRVASALDALSSTSAAGDQLTPFVVAMLGMCLLVVLQSAFSVFAGIQLLRLARALGARPLVVL